MTIFDAVRTYTLRCMAGEEEGMTPRMWFDLLGVFSVFYRTGMVLRRVLFQAGVFSTKRLSCPVISIGNITVGGTGKTSFVELLATRLRDRGIKPCVLLRGYGTTLKGRRAVVVSNGTEILVHPPGAGDEAYLLAKKLPGVPVVMGSDRYSAGAAVLPRLSPDLFLLDDGFQHLGLHRDLDIVLFNARTPFGYGHLLPRGLLREPLSGLKRAGLFGITLPAETFDPGPLKAWLRQRYASTPVLVLLRRPRALFRLPGEEEVELSAVKGERVLAFSGIGDPASFEGLLRALEADVVDHRRFPDHYPYRTADLEALSVTGDRAGARILVTTEKDAVRLEKLPWSAGRLLFALRTELTLVEGEEALELALGEVLADVAPGKVSR
ncbi:MAG: tetraacyldisaccharide 4'-kinase [candidate division NC10 bacterium]|nr:tetraacyldisaccharide 4'-kinase [candidate division NC10 bacterium]